MDMLYWRNIAGTRLPRQMGQAARRTPPITSTSSLPDGESRSRILLPGACTTILPIIWAALAWLRTPAARRVMKRIFFLTAPKHSVWFTNSCATNTNLPATSAMQRRPPAPARATTTPSRGTTTRVSAVSCPPIRWTAHYRPTNAEPLHLCAEQPGESRGPNRVSGLS